MAWSKGQQQAIDSREGQFLVSAGAGSGKTAVLTERIHRLVEEGACSLNEMLVLTFTNKAAHEMKTRVRQAFKNDPEKAAQVESAEITTFDAFALSLVKKYHFALHLDSDIQVMDEGLLSIEKRKILDEILSERYEENNPIFNDFVRHYAIKDDDKIVKMTLKILDYAELSGDKKTYFMTAVEDYFNPLFVKESLERFASLLHAHLETLLSASKLYENPALSDAEGEFLSSFVALDGYEALYTGLVGQKYPTMAAKKEERSALDNALHSSLLAGFNSLRDDISNFGDENMETARLLSTKPYVKIWFDLAEELDARLSAYKAEKGAYSFSDIAYLASQVAAMKEVQPYLRGQYRYVMVDEYQDTSDLQQAFLNAIVGENFFAVGDVKQSIYRFRNANPEIFHQSEILLTENAPDHLISLQDNFRSREEVLEDINALFSQVMSSDLGDVNYQNHQALNYGNLDFAASKGEEHHAEILTYTKSDDLTKEECEARLIAEDIKAKLLAGYPVLAHAKTDRSAVRKCQPKDFAILIARKRDFQTYAKIFNEEKIPLAVSDDQDLSSQDVSSLFLSFLRLPTVMDHDTQAEKHCYASIMRSYLYEEDDETLYQELTSGSYRQSSLFLALREKKNTLLYGGCGEGVRYFFSAYPFFDLLPRIGDVKANYERLISFLSFAEQFDHLGGSYSDFVLHFSDMKKYDVEFALSAGSDAGDSVHLMSIHASKGLQFPIVYSPDMKAKVNLSDASSVFMVNETGVEIPLTMEEGNPLNVWHYLSHNDESMAAISERVRLFYVALTRAEEKIILVEREEPNLSIERIDATNILKIRYAKDADGNDKTTAKLTGPVTFDDFVALSGISFRKKHVDIVPLSPYSAYLPSAPEPAPIPKKIDVPAKLIEKTRASKQSLERLDEGALAYGTRLHRLLQLVDWKSKDTSFILDERERKKIDDVLALDLFKDSQKAEAYSEYAFFDEKEAIHGSIDLLLIYPDKAQIIDYKAKSIDDPAYGKQLATYQRYIERVFHLKVECYLLSIIEARAKRV